ncbi:hypothetical protein KFK09_004061 [Dendrobium nobile]|uniref:CCHC-type domain-containing protein n=1 Tax=Dendrobium nobile TaxID=94219 RepID=A0A8T3BZH9_DENNO|nr:hypothetical protein KFK09_004061 [Dendrobium nobile]
MLLHTLGHSVRNQVIRFNFHRSGDTVSRYFKAALHVVGELRNEFIKPPPSETPYKIKSSNRFMPFFKDCIGVIDETHIKVRVPKENEAAFRGGKPYPTQNVLTSVDFDLRFTYVLAGWEGSAHDATVLKNALEISYGLCVPAVVHARRQQIAGGNLPAEPPRIGHMNFSEQIKDRNVDFFPKKKSSSLIINEGFRPPLKADPIPEGKGKGILENRLELINEVEEIHDLVTNQEIVSAFGFNVELNIKEVTGRKEDASRQGMEKNNERSDEKEDGDSIPINDQMEKSNPVNNFVSAWQKTQHIKLNFNSISTRMSEDGMAVKLNQREYARCCVRIDMEKKLPLGVWIEGIHGRTYQKVEYEKLTSLCYQCGKVGHNSGVCPEHADIQTKKAALGESEESMKTRMDREVEDNKKHSKEEYGPWIHVKFKNNRSRNFGNNGRYGEMIGLIKKVINLWREWKQIRQNSKTNKEFWRIWQIMKWKRRLKRLILRGARKREASLYLREIVKDNDCFFVGLTETNITCFERHDIDSIIGVEWDYCFQPAVGSSGGILVLWKRSLASFETVEVSTQVVMGNLNINTVGSWKVATVYGGKDVQTRRNLWHSLKSYMQGNSPALIVGNFNCLLSKEDKKGGKRFHFSCGPKEMKMFLTNNDFHDLGYVGPRFTWCNNKDGNSRIWERLDRCLVNSIALQKIPMAKVKHLSRIASDHALIVFNMTKPQNQKSKFIRFEDSWKSYPAVWHIAVKAWMKSYYGTSAEILQRKLNRTLKALYYWNKNKCKELNLLKEDLKKDILKLQIEETSYENFTDDKLKLLRSKVHELNVTLGRLAMWWNQRAKVKWHQEVEDFGQIEEVFYEFYSKKWASRNCQLSGWPSIPNNLQLSVEDVEFLNKDFTKEEMIKAVFNQGNNKSPGLDGITTSFFKFFWKIVEEDTWKEIDSFFKTGSMHKDWKDTLVILIPKIKNPTLPSNFRPISLCQTTYKIVATMILNRIKNCISKCITEEQAAFITGRSLSDHCLIAQEIFHKLKITNNKKGFMVIKLDMEQAYDNMSWDALEQVLKLFGMPAKMIVLIMECVKSARFSVIINGKASKWINAANGFRQVERAGPLKARLMWRMIQRPESLLSRVISAKYGEKIWKTQYKNNTSIAWKVLNQGARYLKPLLRWRIANGRSIDVVNDVWLLDKSFKDWPITADCLGLEGLKLNHFIDPTGTWKTEELLCFFNESLIAVIEQIKIESDIPEDFMEEIHSLLGKTITARAYETHCSNQQASEADSGFTIWLKKLKMTPRVEVFWWRLSGGVIPTNEFLKLKKIRNDDQCARDCKEIEDLAHVSAKCKHLQDILRKIQEWGIFVPIFVSLEDCLVELKHLSKVAPNIVILYCNVVFWNWKNKNEVAHGKSAKTVSATAANINVDVALLPSYNAGIGGCFRDDQGRLLVAFGEKRIHWDIANLELAAVTSIRKYLQPWMVEYKGLIIEGDNINVIRFIQDSLNKAKWQSLNRIEENLLFLADFNKVIFNHIHRDGNRVADMCATMALDNNFYFDSFSFDNIPSSLGSLLKKECEHLL